MDMAVLCKNRGGEIKTWLSRMKNGPTQHIRWLTMEMCCVGILDLGKGK